MVFEDAAKLFYSCLIQPLRLDSKKLVAVFKKMSGAVRLRHPTLRCECGFIFSTVNWPMTDLMNSVYWNCVFP